jgi:AcrR family transcriptional regulator
MNAREAILEAADRIFGEVGYDAASTREIAELSGVNKALIHYHFKNKEQLLASVLDQYYEKLGAAVRGALENDEPFEARVRTLVRVYHEFLARNQRFCRIVQREASGGPNAAKIRERMAPLFTLGRELIVDRYPGTRRGDLAAEQLMVTVYGMIVTYFTYSDVLEPLVGAGPLSKKSMAAREKHVLRVVDLLLAEIGGGGADA